MKYTPRSSLQLKANSLNILLILTLTLLSAAPAWATKSTGAPAKSAVPAAPSGLTASASSSNQINLAWADKSTNESGFTVQRASSAAGPWTKVASVGVNVTAYANTGLSADTTFYYRVCSYNSRGSSGYTSVASATTTKAIAPPLDTTAPSVPSGVTATAASSSQIDLSWAAATDTGGSGLAGYKVYRAGVQIATTAGTTYSNTGLAASTSYCYTVAAYDNSGNTSAQGVQSCATTPAAPDTTAPSVPSGVTATAASSSQIDLSWAAATDTGGSGLAGYKVYRAGVQIATTAGTTYSNTGLAASTSYCFTVAAYDNSGNTSAQDVQSCATTPVAPDTTAPSVPTGVTATAASSSQIDLSWVAATDTGGSGLAGYKVYRAGVQIATTTATSYSNTGLAASTAYCYTVAAYDNATNTSAQSVQACATTPATPDTTAPTVSLTAPANGSTVTGTITLSATSSDNVGVAKVDFYRDGSLVGTDTTSPYSVTSDTTSVANGLHSFVAKAYDVAGNIGTSATVTVTVSNTTADTTAPTASLTAPANGSTVSGTITLSATSSDNVGVTKVDFYRDGSLVGTDTTSPYSITSDTTAVANGSHSFVAKAYDVAGNMGTSATVTVTVNNTTADTIAPTVTLTAPSSGSTVSGTITLTAAASDNVGVSKVEYWCDGTTLCATATTSPFSATDNTTDMANGSHSYKAKAFDAAGNSSTSAGTSVTVSNATSAPAQYVWEQQLTCTTSSSFSYVNGTAVDAAGNVVVAGYVKGSANTGGGLVTSAGQADIFVTKYSSNGTYSWSLRIGGASDDMAQGVAVDSVGNVYVIGYFTGTVDFGFGPITSSNPDIFLLKLSAQGAPLWCKQLGGTGVDTGYAVAVDSHDNVLITGFFGYYGTGIDFGFGVLNSAGGRDVFVAKYSPAGTPLWASRFGSTGDDWGTSIAVDRRDDGVLVTGNFKGSADFGGGALTSAGGQDMFLAKYSSTGAHLWSKRFGDTSSDSANSVAVDKDGNVALVGNFLGTVNFGAGALTYHSVSDMFIAEFNAAGGCLWSTNFGSDLGGDVPYGVATDKSDNVVVTGTILGNLDLGSGRLWGTSGSADILIAKFSNVGTHMWSRRYGAGFNDAGSSVAIDPTGNILTGGFFGRSVNFGGTDMTSGNSDTGFLVKLTP